MDIYYLRRALEQKAEELMTLAQVLDENGTRRLSGQEKKLIRQCVIGDILADFEGELAMWAIRGGKTPETDICAWEELG